jgi:hypothetical protein
VLALVAALAFAAPRARAPGEVRIVEMDGAGELLKTRFAPLDCPADLKPRRPDLRFERITSEPDAGEMRELRSRAAQPVNYEAPALPRGNAGADLNVRDCAR